MRLSLSFIRELLETRFTLIDEYDEPELLFDSARFYIGQSSLRENALYIVPPHWERAFRHLWVGSNAPALFFRHQSKVSQVYQETEGGDVPPHLVFRLNKPDDPMEALSLIQEQLDKLHGWETKIADLWGRHASMEEFLRVGYELIENPMILYDDQYLILASTESFHPPVDEELWANQLEAGYITPEIRSCMRVEGFRPVPNIATKFNSSAFSLNSASTRFTLNGRQLGMLLVLEYFKPISPGRLRLIQELSDLLYPELCELSVSTQAGSDSEIFLRTVLTSRPHSLSPEYINEGLASIGWRAGDMYHVLVFSDMMSQVKGEFTPVQLRSCFPSSFSLELDGQLVVIVRGGGRELETTDGLADLLRDSVMRCGISSGFDFFGVQAGLQQARAALAMGRKLDPMLWYYHFHNYSTSYIASFALKHASLEAICDPAILILEREDREHGTDYIRTLEAYLTSGANLKELAASLHMHRNTLQYRLTRISQLTGIDYHDEVMMKNLYISLVLLRLNESEQK